MLKKTITYVDYDGNERKEDFYFNLTMAELTEWLTTNGGYTLDKMMEKLVKTQNSKEIMEIFKTLIQKSYGEKSIDGRRFVKNDEVLKNFTETEAYSQLYMDLVSDPKEFASFFNGIVPANISAEISKVMDDPTKIRPELADYIPKPPSDNNNGKVMDISTQTNN